MTVDIHAHVLTEGAMARMRRESAQHGPRLIDRSAEMSMAASLAAERAAQGMLSTAAESYRAPR